MDLRITHVTGFEYDSLVSASYNEARMTPLSDARQTVRHPRVDVEPHPWTSTYQDYWGTTVTAFEVLGPHRELTVTATSTVRTAPAVDPVPHSTWAELSDPRLVDDLAELLTLTDRVRPPADLARRVARLADTVERPGELAREVCRLVHTEVCYVPGATDVHAEAASAWDQRSGVCQDIAHLVTGALRSAGIPCRYVSGYLLPSADAAPGEVTHGESHAWVEWYCGSWHGYDPTNGVPIGDRHIRVGHGRDYTDVTPLRGVYAGSGSSDLFVQVSITREA